MLRKNQAIEYELRKSVKEAEFQRRRKEKEVEGLREDLIRKKRDDAKKIHDAIARAEDEEKQLHRHLVREKTKLDDVRQTGITVVPVAQSFDVSFSSSRGATTVNRVCRAIETTDGKREPCATPTNENMCVCYAHNLDPNPCGRSTARSEQSTHELRCAFSLCNICLTINTRATSVDTLLVIGTCRGTNTR